MSLYFVAIAVFLLTSCVCGQLSLSDHPIVGSSFTSLNGAWDVSSPQQALYLTGTVPGDLLTDLQRAYVIANPLIENNFKAGAIWNDYTWIYTKTFTLTDADVNRLAAPTTDLLLVFDGIKLGAFIFVNGVQLDTALNQFMRYEFALGSLHRKSPLLKSGDNNVTLVFDPSINVHGMFMDCTGGWDWAPYSDTTGADGNPTFSRGIWKDVYLVGVNGFAVQHVVPHPYYTGDFPTAPLPPHMHADFELNVTVYLYAPAALSDTTTLTLSGSWLTQPITVPVTLNAGSQSISYVMPAAAADINLWWPTGISAAHQPWLYTVSAAVSTATTMVSATRRFGFRTFSLATGNDTDPNYVRSNYSADGSDNLGMRFRINGASVFVRGANMIPMNELEGQYQADAHAQLVKSAKAANMNVIRVWGGGIFYPQVFYDTADEIGVMIYHDMAVRSFTALQVHQDQVRHQIRRLSHHPAIVIWDGCNECYPDDKSPIINVELTIVASEDTTRAIWPASPAGGWKSGVNRLTGRPNNNPLVPVSGGGVQENHGPYLHGTGWPAVNGAPNLQPFDSGLPVSLSYHPIGFGGHGSFTSEFGSSVYSSFESMAPTIAAKHWNIHGGAKADNCSHQWNAVCTGGNVIAQRNYPCDNIVIQYFGGNQSEFDVVGERNFKGQLFKCMIGQALYVKTNIEYIRSWNVYGLIIWQLNEIWPTGGWGSLEYGTTVLGQTGQVLGGRWKPLHHWLQTSLFTDVLISCGSPSSTIFCLIKNDNISPLQGQLLISALDVTTSQLTTVYNQPQSLGAGPFTYWFSVPLVDAKRTVLIGTFTDAVSGAVLTKHVMLLTEPMHIALTPLALTVTVAAQPNADGSIDVTIARADSSSNAALYVTLTTAANGRFSDNVIAFYQTTTLRFIPFGPLQQALLQKTIRAEHVADYMTQTAEVKRMEDM